MRGVLSILVTFACSLTIVPRAAADTIVLKNGRRITATAVVDEGEKVRYQTAAGELSLPKSIIDHIERGGSTSDSSTDSAAKLSIAPPAMDLSTLSRNAQSSAVHDGAVDRNFLAQVGNEARWG